MESVRLEGPELIVPGGGCDEPVAAIRSATLVAAILFAALFVPMLLTPPAPVHKVQVRIEEGAGAEGDPPHRLLIGRDGSIVFNREPQCSVWELRSAFSRAEDVGGSVMEVQPHPESRYEIIVEVLALALRSNIEPVLVVVESGATGERAEDYASPGGCPPFAQ